MRSQIGRRPSSGLSHHWIRCIVAALVGCGLGCSEAPATVCGPGVCPSGSTCNVESGACEPAVEGEPAIGPLGGYISAALTRDSELLVGTYDFAFSAAVLEHHDAEGEVTRWRVDGGDSDTGDVGTHLALALDKSDQPFLAYYDRTHAALRLADRATGAWRIRSVDGGQGQPDVGRWVGLVVDDLGYAHMAYRNQTDKRLRVLSTSAEAPEPYGCRGPDEPGRNETGQNKTGPLELTSEDMAAAGMPSTDFGEHVSLAISGDHRLVFSFYDADRGNLVLGRCEGDQIQLGVLDGEDTDTGQDTGDVGRWASMAVDGVGNVGVAYVDAGPGHLKYASSSQGQAAIEVVDDGSGCGGSYGESRVGQRAALTMRVDTTGNAAPRIAYLDATGRTVRLARRTPLGEWLCEVVPTPDLSTTYGAPALGLDLVVDSADAATVVVGSWALGPAGLEYGLNVVRMVAP